MTKNKSFTITKTGYRAGVYGCIAEYFTLIIDDGGEFDSYYFSGLYGTEQRVAKQLKNAGYKEEYTYSNYGQITRKDIRPNTMGETEIIKELETKLKGAK